MGSGHATRNMQSHRDVDHQMASGFAFARRLASHRVQSEDRAEVLEYGDALVVVVADGAGGMRGGATASDAIVNAVRSKVVEGLFDPYDLRAWSEVFKKVDADLATRFAGESTSVVE